MSRTDDYQRQTESKLRAGAVAYADRRGETVYIVHAGKGYWMLRESRSGEWSEARLCSARERTQLFDRHTVRLTSTGCAPGPVAALRRSKED